MPRERLLHATGLLAALLAAAACTPLGGTTTPRAGEPAKAQVDGVVIYQLRGSRQCEPGSGTPLAAMRAALEAEGVAVRRSACGTDGRMRVAACGAPTGDLHLFEIAPADLSRAETLGYARLSTLHADPASPPQEVPCR